MVERDPGQRQARGLLALIDEFEQFLAELPRVPLTGKVLVDEEDLYGFAEQLRQAVPDEVRRALEVLRERDRILAQARTEAESLLAEARREAESLLEEARRQASRLVDDSAVLRRAEEEAERILQRARQASQQVRGEADAYADEVLSRVEAFLARALEHVRDGRAQLRPVPRPAAEEAAAAPETPAPASVPDARPARGPARPG